MNGAARSSLPVLARGTVAAGAAFGAYAALRRYPPAGEETWRRTNHRGEHVTLLEGPAVSFGAVAAQVITAAVALPARARAASRPDYPERLRPSAYPLAIAGLGGVAFGVLDDLRGSGKRRGLHGHLGALAHGEVTTGTVKLAGLAAAGLGAALVEGGDPADVAVNAGLIAGSANLLNLFDLRPGRAIKVATLSAGLIAAGSALAGGASAVTPPAQRWRQGRLSGLRAVAVPAGAALALLPEDLSERAMLGDAGANALGAMLGAAAAQTLPKRARLGLLAGIVALTLASEKVSFTRVIETTPALHWFDMLGRRPVTFAAPVSISTVSVGTGSGGTVSINTGSAGPLSVRPLSAGPVATDLAATAEPVAMTRMERLAWWVRRRRPGRHRRDKVVL